MREFSDLKPFDDIPALSSQISLGHPANLQDILIRLRNDGYHLLTSRSCVGTLYFEA